MCRNLYNIVILYKSFIRRYQDYTFSFFCVFISFFLSYVTKSASKREWKIHIDTCFFLFMEFRKSLKVQIRNLRNPFSRFYSVLMIWCWNFVYHAILYTKMEDYIAYRSSCGNIIQGIADRFFCDWLCKILTFIAINDENKNFSSPPLPSPFNRLWMWHRLWWQRLGDDDNDVGDDEEREGNVAKQRR